MAKIPKIHTAKGQLVAEKGVSSGDENALRVTSVGTPAVEQSTVFRGSFEHNLDHKGRVSIPSTFRQVLADSRQHTLVISNFITDGTRCLEGFSLEDWKRFEIKLRAKGRFDPEVRSLENFFLARAAVCELDGSGRVTLPQHLRNYASIEREVVFTASLHGFRMWDKRVYELVFGEAEAKLLENPAIFAGLDK